MNKDSSKKQTILAVDDTPENLDVVKSILVPEYIVKAAVNGKIALKIAEAQQPDLILLDILMPGMDGYEVCHALKSNPATAHIPVIFLTAMDDMENEAKGFEIGAADYIPKPVRPAILVARVRTHLKLKHNMEQLQAAYSVIKGQRDRMEQELTVAGEIQASMVPPGHPALPERRDIDLWAALYPAREVGGDLYDFHIIDENRLCFCVGDVSGKGVPAALFMAITKTLIKARSLDDPSTATIVTHVNTALSEGNEASMFVTLFLAILDLSTGEMTYTNAGHNPTLIKRVNGDIEKLTERHGPIVGGVPDLSFKESQLKLQPGDLLLAFTDGVTEAMNGTQELYSDQRLEQLFAATDSGSSKRVLETVIADVELFEAGAERADDITVLALRMTS
jgi:serine phosphatase RsbU (regulator of sigma subunit)